MIFKLCDLANNSCFNDILKQKYIIFNSAKNQNITAKLGNLQSSLSINNNKRFMSRIHTERRAYLTPFNYNETIINSICEFTYDDSDMPYIEDSFCCRLTLELNNSSIENPSNICEMTIIPRPTYCFIPLKIKNNSFLHDKIFPLIAKIYRKKSGKCNYYPKGNMIYSLSLPLMISFTSNLPVIWKISSSSPSKILIGVPLYPTNNGENILIPVRLISDRAHLNNQIISIQCIVDEYFYFNSLIINLPTISLISNFTFSSQMGYLINILLRTTPGLDQQLMFLNVTVLVNSRQGDTINSSKLLCCINPKTSVRQKKSVCENSRFVEFPWKQFHSIPIIPAVNDSTDILSIYSRPNIIIKDKHIITYGISNYKDKTIQDVTKVVKMIPVDSRYITVNNNNNNDNANKFDVEMKYQTFLNPWSIQFMFYDAMYTIIAPVRIWRPMDWKIMLSDNVLQPIKNWAAPESTSDNAICVSRYKVGRMKILCRLFLIEETGERRYIGNENDDVNEIPYIDVTSNTSLSQILLTPNDIISIQKSHDQDHFLIYAKQAGQMASINLMSLDQQMTLATSSISVIHHDIFVEDLIVHCIDALSLIRANRSIKSINKPSDHQSIIVQLSTHTPSQPCHLIVFVVFSDGTIERISTINHSQYRLIVTDGINNKIVTDSQLVIVRYRRQPHINMSLYEPSTCQDSRLIYTKKIEWVTIEAIDSMIIPTTTTTKTSITVASISKKNESFPLIFKDQQMISINLVHISIYICTAVVGFCFISFVLYKLFCYRSRSNDNRSAANNYQRSASGFLEDSNIKIPIRTSNSKNFTALSKCSTNCLRQNTNKTHTNEPYPPLLPPPGPIAANYDLTINDPVCNDSAVDSGIELGKLSSYSSNTCPSNDLCCTIDIYPSCSGTEDSLIHTQYQPPQFSNPMMGFYPQKCIIDPPINQYHDNMMVPSVNSTKIISNLRQPYW